MAMYDGVGVGYDVVGLIVTSSVGDPVREKVLGSVQSHEKTMLYSSLSPIG